MSEIETKGNAGGRGLGLAIAFAAFLFVIDGLFYNRVCLSLICGLLVVIVGVPVSFLSRDRAFRRKTLRDIGIYLIISLVPVIVMINVNTHIAHSRANRLISAVESYRSATGAYPRTLNDLVPKYIEEVPRAQYTITGVFYYVHEQGHAPTLWYNPHVMDHRRYHFDTQKWTYLD